MEGGAQTGRVPRRRAPAAARRVSPEGRVHAVADRLHRHRGRHHRPDLLPARRRAGLGPARPGGRPAPDSLVRPRTAPHRRGRADRRPAPGPRRFAPGAHQPRRRDGGRRPRRGEARQLRPRRPLARRGSDEGEGPVARRRAPLLDPAGLRGRERQLRHRHHGDGRARRPVGRRRRGCRPVPAQHGRGLRRGRALELLRRGHLRGGARRYGDRRAAAPESHLGRPEPGPRVRVHGRTQPRRPPRDGKGRGRLLQRLPQHEPAAGDGPHRDGLDRGALDAAEPGLHRRDAGGRRLVGRALRGDVPQHLRVERDEAGRDRRRAVERAVRSLRRRPLRPRGRGRSSGGRTRTRCRR